MKLSVKFWCKDDIRSLQIQFISGAAEQGRKAS